MEAANGNSRGYSRTYTPLAATSLPWRRLAMPENFYS
nr:MAG TPA: hypothetical protein [Caudoviricetes sp.]